MQIQWRRLHGYLMIALTLALVSCEAAVQQATLETTDPILVERLFRVQGARLNLAFLGSTRLADETCIQPTVGGWGARILVARDQFAALQDGKWRIQVPLGLEGAPESLAPDVEYTLRAWDRDRPTATHEANFGKNEMQDIPTE